MKTLNDFLRILENFLKSSSDIGKFPSSSKVSITSGKFLLKKTFLIICGVIPTIGNTRVIGSQRRRLPKDILIYCKRLNPLADKSTMLVISNSSLIYLSEISDGVSKS